VGKDTLIAALKQRVTDIWYAVTVTTRPCRPGEVPGRSYYFVTQSQYDSMLAADELVAPAEVHGYCYGAPMDELRTAFAAGKDVLLKIDVQGAIQLRRRIPQAVYIFLAPPSIEHLKARLLARRTESENDLTRRLKNAAFEMAQVEWYDYEVVNREEDLEGAVQAVECIINAERHRVRRQAIALPSR
jgi:guanylate kinase